jgi:uncharacterized protein (DUF1015 family)
LLYRGRSRRIGEILGNVVSGAPEAEFTSPDGQSHALWAVTDTDAVEDLRSAFADETLFVADGHHRYETALAYRDEVKAKAASWTGEEPENFAMVALTAADDPGLLVLPIHRVTNVATDSDTAMKRLLDLFEVTEAPLTSRDEATVRRAADSSGGSIVLFSAGSPDSLFALSPKSETVDLVLPQDRSPAWRSLDYSIANHAVLQHCLGLTADEMRDYSRVWFTEDAGEAMAEVRSGKATYAVLMRPVAVERVLELAEAGERMPQKSTFFYPKVPTGLVFNSLSD